MSFDNKAETNTVTLMKYSRILITLLIFSTFAVAEETYIDYAGVAINYQSTAGSITPNWIRSITDQRNQDNISQLSFSPNADIHVDFAYVTNQGTYQIEVVSTQVILRSSVTNISLVIETGVVATASGNMQLQIIGSNSMPMSFMIQGDINTTTLNSGTITYTIQLVHNDGAYTKQIVSAGISNFTEYGSVPTGIFGYTLSHELGTEQISTGASTVLDNSEFILTLFDQAVTNVAYMNTNIMFQLSGHPGATYNIQTTSNLNDGIWTDATNQIPDTDTRQILLPLLSETEQLYYRSNIR